MRSLYLVGLMLAAAVGVARPAAAQQPSTAGIAQRSAVTAQDDASMIGTRPVAVPSGRGMAHGVLIGAGVGAVAGLAVALASPHSSHADNGLGYIAGATIGAFVGMVVGAAIGASRQVCSDTRDPCAEPSQARSTPDSARRR